MKRQFTLLTFVLLTMSAIAQQRMNFLGQPLGCSITTFKQRMASKGYKYIREKETNTYSFKGVFGGDNVYVAALITPKSKIVYGVGVAYADYHSKKNWDYKKRTLIESFNKKYGNYFSDNGTYSHWFLNNGSISIALDYEDSHPLRIYYMDKLGEKMRTREQESDY